MHYGRMPQVTFVTPAGDSRTITGGIGQSVMEIAKRHGVEAIVANCGGSCACATCHVYVDKAWREPVGPPSADEADMLEFAFERRPESRLSCQIRLGPVLDGLVVHRPERQS